jgi:PAS domain S-box-containing protein
VANIENNAISANSLRNNSKPCFRTLSDAVPQLAWTATPAGVCSYVNQHIIEFCGVSTDDFLGAGWQSLHHPDDVVQVINAWTYAIDNASPYEIDFRLKRKDGVYIWHFCQAFPVFDDNEQVTEWFASYTDITARKRAEQERLTTSQLLAESQKLAKVGGWELDIRTGHLFWTLETYHLHDTSPEEFNPTLDAGIGYFLPESRQIITDALDAAINKGEYYDLELEKLTTKGRKIDVRLTCSVTLEEVRRLS